MDTEALKTRYEARILAMFADWRQSFIDDGWFCSEVDDMSDECYSWSMLVQPDGPSDELRDDRDIDVRFTIAESQAYDGSDAGVNFMLDMTAVGGRIVGGMAPYNYTPDVWVPVDDVAELDRRFQMFEALDSESLGDTITEYLMERI